ncbi:MAG: sugar phosphate isomerase/epimerase family protein [Opitutaceae bacterium]|nr:sugar phosphate isomerase/epimerase family protein [Opitutaceae bacterium]
MKASVLERLAVCTWSLQPGDPSELFQQLQAIGIGRVQCALDPIREKPAVWGRFADECSRAGVTFASGMFGCEGEDYSTMESIRRTGGIVPNATWPRNWENIQPTAELAADMGLKLVTFHAGFLPHDESDPAFLVLLDRLRRVADVFATRQIDLGLETGQESADTLAAFLRRLERPNVGVNFDPANMILYEKGNPIAALRTLAPWLKQCHLKDAYRTRVPGVWGDEVPVGTGEVDWPAFFQVLEEIGFEGFCCFEREAGTRRVEDIRSGRRFVEALFGRPEPTARDRTVKE